jgi:hypothetical protein
MTISWKIDEEMGVYPEDLLGNISLHDSMGRRLEESATFLDTFFLALATGLSVASDGGWSSVDIFDEPDPIQFSRNSERITIKYKDASVEFEYRTVVSELIQSYRSLLQYLC